MAATSIHPDASWHNHGVYFRVNYALAGTTTYNILAPKRSGKKKSVLSSDCFEDKNKRPTVVLASELFSLEFKMIPMNHFSPVTVVALWYNYTRY